MHWLAKIFGFGPIESIPLFQSNAEKYTVIREDDKEYLLAVPSPEVCDDAVQFEKPLVYTTTVEKYMGCGHTFDVMASASDSYTSFKVTCPECGKVVKLPSINDLPYYNDDYSPLHDFYHHPRFIKTHFDIRKAYRLSGKSYHENAPWSWGGRRTKDREIAIVLDSTLNKAHWVLCSELTVSDGSTVLVEITYYDDRQLDRAIPLPLEDIDFPPYIFAPRKLAGGHLLTHDKYPLSFKIKLDDKGRSFELQTLRPNIKTITERYDFFGNYIPLRLVSHHKSEKKQCNG